MADKDPVAKVKTGLEDINLVCKLYGPKRKLSNDAKVSLTQT